MNITKIEYKEPRGYSKPMPLAVCTVVLDDCLMLTNIKLCRGKEQGYYLVLPSKQDVLNEVQAMNSHRNVDLVLPGSTEYDHQGNAKWDEYFHPVKSDFYKELRDVMVKGYLTCKKSMSNCYKPVKREE